uniref:Uncharacterized protein n=1 Tax=Rhizophora mucronata TaxID=61149 RepID=A0A2P2JLP9_RHIMU
MQRIGGWMRRCHFFIECLSGMLFPGMLWLLGFCKMVMWGVQLSFLRECQREMLHLFAHLCQVLFRMGNWMKLQDFFLNAAIKMVGKRIWSMLIIL